MTLFFAMLLTLSAILLTRLEKIVHSVGADADYDLGDRDLQYVRYRTILDVVAIFKQSATL
jgi:hypothetical protein